MLSIDVKDAFLTEQQKTPTAVNCQMADGTVVSYGLGRVGCSLDRETAAFCGTKTSLSSCVISWV